MVNYKKIGKLLIWRCRQSRKQLGSQLPPATMAANLEVEDTPALLLPCTSCNRTFRPEALAKHAKVCEKTLMKKRKAFDSSKQRLQGTEVDSYSSPPVTKASVRKGRAKEKIDLGKAIHAVKRPSVDPHTPVRPSDHDECPHCGRFFGPKAFERHTQFCKEQQLKLKATPNINLEAKERLKVRTSYKGPLSNKVLNRDRYQPKRDPSPMSTETKDDLRSRGLTRNASMRSSLRTRGTDSTPPPPLRRTMTQISTTRTRKGSVGEVSSTSTAAVDQKQSMPRLYQKATPEKKLKFTNCLNASVCLPETSVFNNEADRHVTAKKHYHKARDARQPNRNIIENINFGVVNITDFINVELNSKPLASSIGFTNNKKCARPGSEEISQLHSDEVKSKHSKLPKLRSPKHFKILSQKKTEYNDSEIIQDLSDCGLNGCLLNCQPQFIDSVCVHEKYSSENITSSSIVEDGSHYYWSSENFTNADTKSHLTTENSESTTCLDESIEVQNSITFQTDSFSGYVSNTSQNDQLNDLSPPEEYEGNDHYSVKLCNAESQEILSFENDFTKNFDSKESLGSAKTYCVIRNFNALTSGDELTGHMANLESLSSIYEPNNFNNSNETPLENKEAGGYKGSIVSDLLDIKDLIEEPNTSWRDFEKTDSSDLRSESRNIIADHSPQNPLDSYSISQNIIYSNKELTSHKQDHNSDEEETYCVRSNVIDKDITQVIDDTNQLSSIKSDSRLFDLSSEKQNDLNICSLKRRKSKESLKDNFTSNEYGKKIESRSVYSFSDGEHRTESCSIKKANPTDHLESGERCEEPFICLSECCSQDTVEICFTPCDFSFDKLKDFQENILNANRIKKVPDDNSLPNDLLTYEKDSTQQRVNVKNVFPPIFLENYLIKKNSSASLNENELLNDICSVKGIETKILIKEEMLTLNRCLGSVQSEIVLKDTENESEFTKDELSKPLISDQGLKVYEKILIGTIDEVNYETNGTIVELDPHPLVYSDLDVNKMCFSSEAVYDLKDKNKSHFKNSLMQKVQFQSKLDLFHARSRGIQDTDNTIKSELFKKLSNNIFKASCPKSSLCSSDAGFYKKKEKLTSHDVILQLTYPVLLIVTVNTGHADVLKTLPVSTFGKNSVHLGARNLKPIKAYNRSIELEKEFNPFYNSTIINNESFYNEEVRVSYSFVKNKNIDLPRRCTDYFGFSKELDIKFISQLLFNYKENNYNPFDGSMCSISEYQTSRVHTVDPLIEQSEEACEDSSGDIHLLKADCITNKYSQNHQPEEKELSSDMEISVTNFEHSVWCDSLPTENQKNVGNRTHRDILSAKSSGLNNEWPIFYDQYARPSDFENRNHICNDDIFKTEEIKFHGCSDLEVNALYDLLVKNQDAISEDSLENTDNFTCNHDNESFYSDSLKSQSPCKSPILFWNNQRLYQDLDSFDEPINTDRDHCTLNNDCYPFRTPDVCSVQCNKCQFYKTCSNCDCQGSFNKDSFFSTDLSYTNSRFYYQNHIEKKSSILMPMPCKKLTKKTEVTQSSIIDHEHSGKIFYGTSQVVEEEEILSDYSTDTESMSSKSEPVNLTSHLRQCSKIVEYFQDGNDCHTVETSIYELPSDNHDFKRVQSLPFTDSEQKAVQNPLALSHSPSGFRKTCMKLPPIKQVNGSSSVSSMQQLKRDVYGNLKPGKNCLENNNESYLDLSLDSALSYRQRPENYSNLAHTQSSPSYFSSAKNTHSILDESFANPVQSPRSQNRVNLPRILPSPLRPSFNSKPYFREAEKYSPYLSAERQMLELFGGDEVVKSKSPTALPEIPSSNFSPLQSSPTSAFVKYSSPVRSSSSESLNKENNNPRSPENLKPNNFSLSSLSLCSVVSLDSVDCNKNPKSSGGRLDNFQRSFSAVESKPRSLGRSKINMREMLYGAGSPDGQTPQSEGSNSDPGNLEACEAELLISMLEFEKMLKSSPLPYLETSPTLCTSTAVDNNSKQINNETEKTKNLKNLNHGSIDSAYSSLTRSGNGDGDGVHTEQPNFCHECGAKYPVVGAKFCCNCGMKRIAL